MNKVRETCRRCNGRGWYIIDNYWNNHPIQHKCEKCGGKGYKLVEEQKKDE